MDELDKLLGDLTIAVEGIDDLTPTGNPPADYQLSGINSPDFSKSSKNPLFQSRSRSGTTTGQFDQTSAQTAARSRSSSFASRHRQPSAFSFQLSQHQLLPMHEVSSDGASLGDVKEGKLRITDSNETVVVGSQGSIDRGLDSNPQTRGFEQEDRVPPNVTRRMSLPPPAIETATSPAAGPQGLITVVEMCSSMDNIASMAAPSSERSRPLRQETSGGLPNSTSSNSLSNFTLTAPSIRSTAIAPTPQGLSAKPISAFGPRAPPPPSADFVANCNTALNPVGFFQLDDAPLCEAHYHARREAICVTCQKIILGVCVNAFGGNRYHKGCFVCNFCKKGLEEGGGDKFKARNGKPYCTGCHGKLFG
ncbi:hypothetical protein HDU67_004754 [Dinochytrium kinnereticum]|nr:hypothetical protein HDU67_004754 [Dinochytrium kinnereticum]